MHPLMFYYVFDRLCGDDGLETTKIIPQMPQTDRRKKKRKRKMKMKMKTMITFPVDDDYFSGTTFSECSTY
jgi:hypothetical protein